MCPSSGEKAGVGRPGGEDGTGDESLRRRAGRDLDLAFEAARDLDGAGDG